MRMSQKKRNSSIAVEMDSFLKKPKENTASREEYEPLLEIGQMLAERDYSKQSDKDAIFRRIMHNEHNHKEIKRMTNRKKWARFSVTAATLAAVGIISLTAVQPSFASNLVVKIMNTISLGHISVSQMEPEPEGLAISDEVKEQMMAQKKDQSHQADTLVVKEADKLNPYTSFNVLLPTYLPEGYVFDRAEFYKNEEGIVINSKYIDVYYVNPTTGKHIFMQQRHADKETAFAMSTTHKIELIKLGNTEAVVSGHSIDWEANGVLYGISAKGLQKEEIVKIAESIKQ